MQVCLALKDHKKERGRMSGKKESECTAAAGEGSQTLLQASICRGFDGHV